MTDLEIESLKKYISYFKTVYGMNISQEDFIHDIDMASMVKDSASAFVNYQNVYKKYLKKVSEQAYLKCFSFSNIKGAELSFKKTAANILLVYEIMMFSILKSSIFDEYNDLPIAESIFAGFNQTKYLSEITPEDLPKTCVEEYTLLNQKLDIEALMDSLLIKMYDYKNASNKELVFKRISMLYSVVTNEHHLLQILEEKKRMNEFLEKMSQILDVSKKELIKQMHEKSLEQGNYKTSIMKFVDVYKEEDFFKKIRNRFEENEEELNDSLTLFEKKVSSNEPYEIIDFVLKDEIFDEGGNKNA